MNIKLKYQHFIWKMERWRIVKWFQYIPVRIKLHKDKQYDGDDEFHHSLNMDVCSMIKMNENQQAEYMKDLVWRRNQAHYKDIEVQDNLMENKKC